MSIKFLKETSLEELYKNISNNLDRYESTGFTDMIDLPTKTHSHDGLTFDMEKLKNIVGSVDSDAKNAIKIFQAMPGLTPYLAKDERLWSYLCHTVFFEYINERWPMPENASDERKINHIKLHFFAKSDRNFERDNGASRLWWGGFFASKVKNMTFEGAINTYFRNQDFRGHIIGRPNSSTSMNLFGILLEKFSQSLEGDRKLAKRENYQKYLKEVNLMGGRSLIPVMTDLEIKEELRFFEEKILGVENQPDSEDPSRKELDEKLASILRDFDQEVISKKFPNTPEESKILNEDNIARFVAYKPTDTSEFLDLDEAFTYEVRESLSSQGEFLKQILDLINTFIEENYF